MVLVIEFSKVDMNLIQNDWFWKKTSKILPNKNFLPNWFEKESDGDSFIYQKRSDSDD